MNLPTIRRRSVTCHPSDWPAEVHPILARVYAGRGVQPTESIEPRLAQLASPAALGGIDAACALLIEAIERGKRICIVGDFDADGATGTAVAVRALRLLGAGDVIYRVPNRFRHGYGLSPGLVEEMRSDAPDLIVTVDNGIASHAGVEAARALGIRTIVTDHHLPSVTLPAAEAIVNPNLAGDAFPSKAIAGVGVVFYLMLALRARLRAMGRYAESLHGEPDLVALLDLVALGTVADLVPLDANNRVLVTAGLKRIRAGRACAGVQALFRAAGRDPTRAVAADLAFALAPRVNAAGRLEDMDVGIECLLTDDASRAADLAERLSAINAQRREMQTAMVEQGEATVAAFIAEHGDDAFPQGVVLFQPDWHAGIVGLVASRLKDRLHRPVFAFAPGEEGGDLRGSGRSIESFHLRDALAEVDARCPGLIARFGGHAMAAGLSLAPPHIERFAAEFAAVARARLDGEVLERVLWSDGALDPAQFDIEVALVLRYAGPWGQAFAEPLFDNVFRLESWRRIGEEHLQLRLLIEGRGDPLEAVMFHATECIPPPARLRAAYHLDVDEWNGRERLRLLVRHIEAA